MSGVDAVVFWLATYSWDLLNYLAPMLGIIIMFAAFQVESLKDDLGVICLLLVIATWNTFHYSWRSQLLHRCSYRSHVPVGNPILGNYSEKSFTAQEDESGQFVFHFFNAGLR